MKRILLALTTGGFLLSLAPRAQADTEVSLNFFYDNLSDQGNWIEVADYGYCFQPNVAVSSSDWRPYADGYWAYTDSGWTWVSYEDFGWATYHYGRWASLDSYGWVWVPGYEWGPAWVSWRTGGDYVGWAPLPPEPVGVVYEGRAITGRVDFTFGIGPLYYNFVDIRYIGEPVLRQRIYAPSRNVTIINNTVNVTNITYNNSRVYNYGPDYNRLNQYSTRPIQRLNLQRETAVGASFGQAGRRGNFNRVNGNQLMVVAPQIEKSQQPLAPKQVKARVEKPKVERGWQGVANRQQLQAEMKQENAKHIPPPSFKPRNPGRQKSDLGQQLQFQLNEANNAKLEATPKPINKWDDHFKPLERVSDGASQQGGRLQKQSLKAQGVESHQPGQDANRAAEAKRAQETKRPVVGDHRQIDQTQQQPTSPAQPAQRPAQGVRQNLGDERSPQQLKEQKQMRNAQPHYDSQQQGSGKKKKQKPGEQPSPQP